MRPTPEQLKEVEAHASNFLSPIEICLVMGFCLNDISYFDKQDNPLYLSYQKGRLKAKSEVNAKIIALAKEGSVPAQEMALKIIKDSNSD